MADNTNTSVYNRKPFQELEFTDDFMFRAVLMSDTYLCIKLIELLLDVEVERIVYKDDDHKIAYNSDVKSVRLDVYLKDEVGTVFDLEMQNNSDEDLPKRSRYYQSMIDRHNLLAGKLYEDLPDSYIVFICTFDPCDRGLHKYEFRQLCVKDPSIELRDGTTRVFINAKGKRDEASEEMKAFLDYLCGKGASSELTNRIDSVVADVKGSRSLEEEYMTIGEEMARFGRKEHARGLAEGKAEGRDDVIRMYEYLSEQNRDEDLKRAFEDPAFRDEVFREMREGLPAAE